MQDNYERPAVSRQGFKQFILWCRQIEVGTVTANNSIDLKGHFFTFELWGEANEGHDHVGFFGTINSLLKQDLRGRLPL